MLADMLATLRLSGGVFVDAELRAPFTVKSHYGPEDCAPYFPVPRRLIAYHYVREGRTRCEIVDGPSMEAAAGEIILLPRNDPHYLHGAESTLHLINEEMTSEPEGSMLRIRGGGDGEATALYCGYLGTVEDDVPLLDSLPPIMVIGMEAVGGDWFERSLDFAAQNVGLQSPEMVGKLAEALFAEAVRRYVEDMPEGERGWLAGLRDSAVCTALQLIHGRYAEAWTLDALAREAGVSKTVLAERFRALIGESAMQYCARWRMRVAANMLRDDRQNACSVAYSVGFNSEAAFNRAFKREYGVPPATWQRSLAA